MTYTPEQHAEAVEWVTKNLAFVAWGDTDPGMGGVSHLQRLLRYLLGRLKAHRPSGRPHHILTRSRQACECSGDVPTLWPDKEVIAALDLVAELRAA